MVCNVTAATSALVVLYFILLFSETKNYYAKAFPLFCVSTNLGQKDIGLHTSTSGTVNESNGQESVNQNVITAMYTVSSRFRSY